MRQAIAMAPVYSGVEQDLIRREVDRLIEHEHFRASKRNKRFLAFVVDETLRGRSDRIKAYTIAVDVFGRGAEFDPTSDPIVRIEATRLRVALTDFYDRVEVDAPLRVGMPKGKYIPTFVGASHQGGKRPSELTHSAVQTRHPACALVEIECAVGLRSTEAIHLACDLTVESLKACEVKVIYTPSELRVAARKAFEDFLKDPGSAYAIDILASGNSLFWRVTSLADDVILTRERLCHASDPQASLDAIRAITDRIAGMVSGTDVSEVDDGHEDRRL